MPHSRTAFAVLTALCLILIFFYVFWGLDAQNWAYNFPRRMKITAAVVLVSMATGLSSVTFQTITANHILTPSIMGLDNLYLFMQTAVVFAFGSGQLVLMNDVPSFLLALLLMTGAAVALFLVMFRGDEQNVYYLVLVGFIFGTVFSGLSSFMQLLIDPNEFSVLEGRMFASFNRINVELLGVAGLIIPLACLAGSLDFKFLDVLTLGRGHAVNLGVNYRAVVLRTLVLIAVMTSAATVLVGPVTFLGILVVSLARAVFKSFRHRDLVPGAMLISIAVLFGGMLVTERVFSFKTPLSVVINFIGGVYFIFLLLRKKTHD